MTTMLEKPLRREIWINNKPYTLTLTQAGFTLVEKRRRRGFELMWNDLLNGDQPLSPTLAAQSPVRSPTYMPAVPTTH